jgi:hypothetical protein
MAMSFLACKNSLKKKLDMTSLHQEMDQNYLIQNQVFFPTHFVSYIHKKCFTDQMMIL